MRPLQQVQKDLYLPAPAMYMDQATNILRKKMILLTSMTQGPIRPAKSQLSGNSFRFTKTPASMSVYCV